MLRIKSITNCGLKMIGDTRQYTGYASTFGNVDSYNDTVMQGAYTATLAKHGLPKMFFNHDRWSVPIGKWIDAKEDKHGLLMTGEFTPGIKLADDVYAALKHETITGLSIGYELAKDDYEEKPDGGCLIRQVTFLKEVSPVNFPADTFATISTVKNRMQNQFSAIDGIKSLDEFEQYLVDCHGISKSEAKALTWHLKSLFPDPAKAIVTQQWDAALLARLDALKSKL